MNKVIRILLLEDNFDDQKLFEHELKSNKINYKLRQVEEEEIFVQELREFNPDVVISDYNLPSFDGMRALEISKKINPILPFIIITGSLNEEIAVSCMKSGADDYVIKEHVGKIVPSILNLIQQSEIRSEKLKAESEILRWKERYEIVTGNSGQVIYDYDAETGNIVWSGNLQDVLGYSNNEIRSVKDLIRNIHPDDRKLWADQLIIAENEIGKFNIEYRFLHKNGNYIYLADTGVFITGSNGKAKSMLGGLQDISDRKLAQESLAKLNECFLQFDSEPINNIHRLITFSGKELEAEYALYNRFQDNFFTDELKWNWDNQKPDIKELNTILLNTVSKEPFTDKKVLLTKLIKKNIVSISVEKFIVFAKIITFEGEPVGILYISFNNNRLLRKQELKIIEIIASGIGIEEKRRITQHELYKLHVAVEQNPNMVMLTDIHGKVEYVNPAYSKISGYSPDEVLGKNPVFLNSGVLPRTELLKIRSLMRTGQSWSGEFQNRRKNGEVFWEKALISNIKNNLGEVTNFLIIKEDITDRKNTELELIKAKDLAEKSDNLKTEFLAQMSHEIRTPLNTILSVINLLKEEFDIRTDKNLDMSFKIIENGSKRLIRTIDLILNMSQLQSGNYETNPTYIDLEKDVIEIILLDFFTIAKEKKIDLSFENHNVSEKVKADPVMLSQIFFNLIDNAIKYTPSGSVRIYLFKDEKGKICVEIADTGIGISDDYLPLLFTPFSQEQTGYTRAFDGNGLGLALVKKYADLNNAEIQVKSKKGQGSTFQVKFN